MNFFAAGRRGHDVAGRAISAFITLAAIGGCGGGSGAAGSDASTALGDTRSQALSAGVGGPNVPGAKPPVMAIRAAGSSADGVGAHAVVRFEGRIIAEGEVKSITLANYQIELPGALDGGALDVVLLNALDSAGRPLRSLQIESVTVAGIELRPNDADVVFDQGEGEAAFDGKNLSPGSRTMARNGALRFNLPTAAEVIAAAQAITPAPGVYIDADRGNDSHSGTADSPWRTITHLAGTVLPAGHGIYLRCGSIWRTTLALSATQLTDGSIIAGYGPECARRKAVVSGADDFSGGWQRSGNVWSRSLPPGTPKITQLFMDGQPLRTAQWPNSAGRYGAQTGTSSNSNRRMALTPVDAAALTGMDLVGAVLQMRTQPWLIETRRITATGGGQIDLDTAPEWKLDGGEGYVLQDKRWMLDSAGEFFHDIATQQLHLITPATQTLADPNQALVEGSVRDVAVSLTGRKALLVRDIATNAAREVGLQLPNAPLAQVHRIEAQHNAGAGVRLSQWPRGPSVTAGPRVSDSRFYGNGRYGIDAVDVDGAVISRNRVLATGSSVHHKAGVIAAIGNGPGGRTEDNIVEDSGYQAINFSSLGGSVVARNTVSGYCRRLTDCGAIYTWTGKALAPIGVTSLVEANRVLEAGQRDAADPAPDGGVVGIYIDDFSHGAMVQNNLIAGPPVGVFVHNSSHVRVSGNRIWLPAVAALWLTMDQTDADSAVDNRFTDNEIVPLVQAHARPGTVPTFSTSQMVWIWHATSGAAALAPGHNHFGGNRVVQLQGALAGHARFSGPADEKMLDASAWRELNPAEPAPSRPVRFVPLSVTLGPELVVDGQFESGVAHWRTWQDPNGAGLSVLARSAAPGCAGSCVRFTAGTSGDYLASQPFSMRPGVPHLYRWSASLTAAVSPASVGAPYISRETSPWDGMNDAQGFVSFGSRRGAAGESFAYETLFVPKAANPARVNLQMDSSGVPVLLDSVSVREVTAMNMAVPSDWAAVITAAAGSARAIDCTALGWPVGCSALNVHGQPVPLPILLPAGGAQLLLRADSPYRL